MGPTARRASSTCSHGRRQLIVYRAFFEPGVHGWPEHGCIGCSMMADQVAHLSHLNARDTTLVFVSRAPQADITRVKARMGWEMPWFSLTDDFDADFGVDEWHGTNAFIRDGGKVFRTYFINNRGDEAMGSTWSYLDITALGRQEEWEDSPEGYPQTPPYEWWNWHDERDRSRILIDRRPAAAPDGPSGTLARVVGGGRRDVGHRRLDAGALDQDRGARRAARPPRARRDRGGGRVPHRRGPPGPNRRGLGHGVPARRDAGGGADADDRRRRPRPRPDPGDDGERVGRRPRRDPARRARSGHGRGEPTSCGACWSASCARARWPASWAMPSPAPRRCPPRSCAGPRCCRATSATPPWSRSPKVPPDCAVSGSRWGAASSRCSRPARRMSAPRSPTSDAASVEWKLDGARIQVHRIDDDVRDLHAQPQRHHRPATRRRGVGAPAAGARGRARRRGDRRRRRSPAARVPGHDELVRTRPHRGRGCRGRARRVLLRRAARRRRRPHRPAARRATRGRARARGRAAHPRPRDRVTGRGRGVPRRRARGRSRGRDGEGTRLDLRRRSPRWRVAQGEAGADAGSRRARGRMGARAAAGLALEPAPRRTRSRRHVRHGRQDVQGPDRRHARVADEGARGARDRPRRDHRASCAPSWWSRSRSTACRRRAATRAASRCGSRGSAATATTRPPRPPTRSRRSRRSYRGEDSPRPERLDVPTTGCSQQSQKSMLRSRAGFVLTIVVSSRLGHTLGPQTVEELDHAFGWGRGTTFPQP